MKILCVNAGSSTLKFRLYEMPEEKMLMKGNVERIGLPDGMYSIRIGNEKIEKDANIPDHAEAINILLKELVDNKLINSLDEIKAVGHRVVHGGNKYSKSVVLDKRVMREITEISSLAPLHNPANLTGAAAFMEAIPGSVNVACFDTAFHQTMKDSTYLYPVPYEWYVKYDVRKYGFHGLSHKFITETMKERLNNKKPNLIICHIGNGASVSAIKDGICIDTSMGFTPLPGIMMGTRSGDIDPSIVSYVALKEGKDAADVVNDLNKKSGFLGLSGVSNDFRDVYQGLLDGNERCKLAIDKYVKTVVNYIAMYYVELGGIDILCFTAGLGENAIPVREMICDKLACLGIKIDKEKNNTRGEVAELSTDDSTAKVFVVPTNEELMIAEDTYELVNK
mgnify:CR=1 FL=1